MGSDISYDMMQRYCKDYVHLQHLDIKTYPPRMRTISTGRSSDWFASGDGDDIEFDGLEPAQRKVMYDYFDEIEPHFLGKRARIRSDGPGWKDLINNWDFAN